MCASVGIDAREVKELTSVVCRGIPEKNEMKTKGSCEILWLTSQIRMETPF